jgi:hypothetical protein
LAYELLHLGHVSTDTASILIHVEIFYVILLASNPYLQILIRPRYFSCSFCAASRHSRLPYPHTHSISWNSHAHLSSSACPAFASARVQRRQPPCSCSLPAELHPARLQAPLRRVPSQSLAPSSAELVLAIATPPSTLGFARAHIFLEFQLVVDLVQAVPRPEFVGQSLVQS